MWHLLTAKYSQKQTPEVSIYSIDSDWQKSRTRVPLLWHSWDLLHARKHTHYCYGMPRARAGTRRDFPAALQISVSGFWVVPNTACPNLLLNGNPFHQWLIYAHCYSPPPLASSFPNMEKVWMHKKGWYFYPCRDKTFFYCTVTLLVTTSPRESYFMDRKITTSSRKKKHLYSCCCTKQFAWIAPASQ